MLAQLPSAALRPTPQHLSRWLNSGILFSLFDSEINALWASASPVPGSKSTLSVGSRAPQARPAAALCPRGFRPAEGRDFLLEVHRLLTEVIDGLAKSLFLFY